VKCRDYLVLELVGEVGGVEECQRLLPQRELVLRFEDSCPYEFRPLEPGSDYRVPRGLQVADDQIDLAAPS
jgi:hypothetical protein